MPSIKVEVTVEGRAGDPVYGKEIAKGTIEILALPADKDLQLLGARIIRESFILVDGVLTSVAAGDKLDRVTDLLGSLAKLPGVQVVRVDNGHDPAVKEDVKDPVELEDEHVDAAAPDAS